MTPKEHIVLNSSPWFSAITDYSWQFINYLQSNGYKVSVFARENSPLYNLCQERSIPCQAWPSQGGKQAFKSIFKLIITLFKSRGSLLWTYEGSEHTVCALLGIFLKKHRVIRMRGQAQDLSGGVLKRWIYGTLTHKVVFASRFLKEKSTLRLKPEKVLECPYAVDFKFRPAHPFTSALGLKQWYFQETLESMVSSGPLFLNLGRFDPVKGHYPLIQGFSTAVLESQPLNGSGSKPTLFIMGRSENISAFQLFHYAQDRLGPGKQWGPGFYAVDDARCRICIVDGHGSLYREIMEKAHFGVISSQGSEAICRVGVEFLFSGTPVLFTPVGSLPQILEVCSEWQLDGLDAQAFTSGFQRALRWLEEHGDWHTELRMRSRQYALDHFTHRAYGQLLTEVLGGTQAKEMHL